MILVWSNSDILLKNVTYLTDVFNYLNTHHSLNNEQQQKCNIDNLIFRHETDLIKIKWLLSIFCPLGSDVKQKISTYYEAGKLCNQSHKSPVVFKVTT